MLTEKLLIVDDQGDLRHMLRIALGYGKYKMFEAATGAEAVQIAQREVPDVIVLDVMMPGDMDGFAACRAIKDDPAIKNCFVVLLTALDQATHIESGRTAGADAYMIKPFSPTQLVEIIETRGSAGLDMQVFRPGNR
jgi:two-component system, OmpR family, phosphate regulon response regulator PhoB